MRFTATVLFLIGLSSVEPGEALAQGGPPGNVRRPPGLTTRTRVERLEALVSETLAHFATAVRYADTISLALAVPLAIVPQQERVVSLGAGCQSPAHASWALREAMGPPDERDVWDRIFVEYEEVVVSEEAGRVAIVRGSIARYVGNTRRYAPFELTLALQNGSVVVSDTKGLASGLCGLARREGR